MYNKYILFIIVIIILIIYLSVRRIIQRFYFVPNHSILSTKFTIEKIGNHSALVKKGVNNNKCLLISHGNAGNITFRDGLFTNLKQYNGDIYCYEYPSFSNIDGKLTINNCIDQHLFWLKYLENKYPQIDLWGESIGGGIITETIAKLNPKKKENKMILNKINRIYLQSTFSSISNIIQHISKILYFFYKLLLLDDLNTIKNLAHPNFYKIKITQFHSKNDEIIPFSEVIQINNSCKKNGLEYQFIEIGGTHNNPIFPKNLLFT